MHRGQEPPDKQKKAYALRACERVLCGEGGSGDGGAYFIGGRYGKRKCAPAISPVQYIRISYRYDMYVYNDGIIYMYMYIISVCYVLIPE